MLCTPAVLERPSQPKQKQTEKIFTTSSRLAAMLWCCLFFFIHFLYLFVLFSFAVSISHFFLSCLPLFFIYFFKWKMLIGKRIKMFTIFIAFGPALPEKICQLNCLDFSRFIHSFYFFNNFFSAYFLYFISIWFAFSPCLFTSSSYYFYIFDEF